MNPLLIPFSLALCTAALAQSPIANFGFEGSSLASSQPSFAAVSDLSISNTFQFGGNSGDTWLCLTTAWNNTGGTVSLTVTPNAGESVNFSALRWAAVTNNAAISDSVRAVTVLAGGTAVGTIDPLTHNTINEVDLTGAAFLQDVSAPVTFELQFTGNPNGQSSYEIGYLEVLGDPCALEIAGVTPSDLPIVTTDCFIVAGDCLDQLASVVFGTMPLDPYVAGMPLGEGSYEVVDPHTLRICPPLCLDAATYPIVLTRGNGEMATVPVDLFLPVQPTVACPATHPVGTDLCIYTSSGQLPQPNAIFLIVSDSNLPSVIPGVIDAGIGNMFTSYICGPPTISECAEDCYAIPMAIAGTTFYFQSIVWNPFQTILPLPLTEVCSTTFN